MPQPRRQPPPPESNAGKVVAGALAAKTVGAAAAGPLKATGISAAGVVAGGAVTIAALIKAFDELAERRFRSAGNYVFEQVRDTHPDLRPAEVRRLIAQEEKFEAEFRRKQRERLKVDLAKVFAITDPKERQDALDMVIAREKRYTLAREEAMLLRALGKAEALLLEGLSPEGAYWKLSPHVAEHTLDCLAMGEKFWPWTVLKGFQPPVHHGCACYLLGLDEAVGMGLMTADQVPDPADAVARARQLLKDAMSMEETLEPEVIRAYIDSLVSELAGENVIALAEGDHNAGRRGAKKALHKLRWGKGFERGGQFRPRRGGSAGRALADLFPAPMSPLRGKERRRSRWVWIDGKYTRIPEDSRWASRVGNRAYHSPPGSTAVYRDGKLLDGPGAISSERSSAFAARPTSPSENVQRAAEQVRAALRFGTRVRAGDGASALLGLEDQGYTLIHLAPQSSGTSLLQYRHGITGATVDVEFDGKHVSDVSYDDTPAQLPVPYELGRPPESWGEFVKDGIAWAHELGARYDAPVTVPDIRVSGTLDDHAGTHRWTGEVELGRDVPLDIDRAGAKRVEGRSLNDAEMAGVWASYWVAAHEAGHGVNAITYDEFEGANANLEEALTEEMAHVLAVERLTEQGQFDVLKWRDAHRKDPAVSGVYGHERAALGVLLDQAGITDPFERRVAIEELKFRVAPAQRLDTLAVLIHQHSGRDLDAVADHVELTMAERDGGKPGAALPFSAESPAYSALWRLGYGRLGDGELSPDGMELRLPDGEKRVVEKLPLVDASAELAAITDGWAVAKYPPGQRRTSGLKYADGSGKSFRYVDSLDRGKLILRGFTGKGMPGTETLDDASARLAQMADGDLAWVNGVPVKRRYDGSFGVGIGPDDMRVLSPTIRSARAAAEVAFSGGWNPALVGPRSPGKKKPKAAQDSLFDSLKKKSKGAFSAFEDDFLDSLFAASDPKGKKGKKGPVWVDPMIGKVIGGNKTAKDASPLIPNYDKTRLELGKVAGGSNGARWAFTTNKAKHRWLVKHYRGQSGTPDPSKAPPEDRVATELLANAVYRAMGAKAAVAGTITWDTGKPKFSERPDDIPDEPFDTGKKRASTGIVVLEPDGRVWVYEPKGHFGGYEHTFPKGGVESGLSLQQNAHKELWEETGLHAEIFGVLGDYEGDTGVTRYYVARRTGGTPHPDDPTPHVKGSGAETAAVKLVSREDAASMLNRSRDKQILKDLGTVTLPDTPVGEDQFPANEVSIALTYPTLDGETKNFKPSAVVGEHYMTDALLANWDFVGATMDNIMWTPEGDPVRLDQGGTLELRAQGMTKPYGPVPTEVWTMLSKGQGKRGVLVTEDQMRAQAAEIRKRLTDKAVDELVDAAPFADQAMRERIRENLKARRDWMGRFADGLEDLPRPADGDAGRDAMRDGQAKLHVLPEEEDALYGFVEGLGEEINGVLRAGKIKEASKPVQKASAHLDELLRHARVPEDVYGYIALDGDPGDDLVGKTLQEKGFLGVDHDPGDAPAYVRLTIPADTPAISTLRWDDMPASPELLVARDSKIQITARREVDGKVVLDGVVKAYSASKPWTSSKPKAKPKGGITAKDGRVPPAVKWILKDLKAGSDASELFDHEIKALLAAHKDVTGKLRAYLEDELARRIKEGHVALEEAKAGNTGAMVALYPSKAVQKALAVPYGEPRDEIHLTLALLGKAADLDGERLKKLVAGFAETCPPITGEVSGIGKFTAGPDPVTYASADCPNLPEQREKLVGLLDDAGIPPSREHGFTPHITIAYADRDVGVKNHALRFDAVTLKLGDDRFDFPLRG